MMYRWWKQKLVVGSGDKDKESPPETSQQVAREVAPCARDRSFERKVVTDERDIFPGMSETTYVKVPATFLGACCLRRDPNRCPYGAVVHRRRDYSR
jgi:hypothetical protein